MLVGITVVVNELQKGQRLVFRYPPEHPTLVKQKSYEQLDNAFQQYYKIRFCIYCFSVLPIPNSILLLILMKTISDEIFAKLFHP